MTTTQMLQKLKSAGKPIHLSHLYRLFAILDIKPAGRARPQNYPNDAAERLLSHFGLGRDRQATTAEMLGIKPHSERATKLVSVNQMRAARPKAKGTK